MKILKLILGIISIIVGCFMILGLILEIPNQGLALSIMLIIFVGIIPIVTGIILLHNVVQLKK
ncbi:MAG: hypothetical protein WC070_02175 [Candidatus Magasanikbacteria bacterium]